MIPFDKPTRQSSVAILFIFGRMLRLLVRQLWVVVLIVLFNPKKRAFSGFTIGFLAIAAYGTISSLIAYYRTFFYIKDEELVLEKGLFRRSKITVPLDRIQTVNFQQGVLHQMFDVVSIEIDTAGSAGREFMLDAVARKDAEALRAYVDTKTSANLQLDAIDPTPGISENNTNSHPQLLFQLGIGDLVKIGVSQNHFRTAGIIMLFFISFLDDMEEVLDRQFADELPRFLGMAGEAEVFHYLLIGVPFFLLVSFFITLVRTVLQYFMLRFWRTPNGFKMESGLFTKQEVSANLQKIQYIRWDTSPLMRLFGMHSVRLVQAASIRVGKRMSAAVVPGCREHHLAAIRHAYFPEENVLEETAHGVHWRMLFRLFIGQGLLPVGLLLLLTYHQMGKEVWIWLVWLPFALWLGIRYQRSWRWIVSTEGIRLSWGVFNRRTILLQWYKVQALTIRQNWLLRERGLVNVILYTAAGSVTLPYIPIEKAQAMRDYVLYKVESDDRAWM